MHMDLESLLIEALTAQGFDVSRQAALQGSSGTSYTVSLTAARGSDRFLVDVLSARPAVHRDVEALQGIVSDVGLAGAILLALKGVTEEVRYAPPPANVEVWERATLERAIGSLLLDRALAAPPEPAPDAVAITFTPARAEAPADVHEPVPSLEATPAAPADDDGAELLPGRHAPPAARAEAPAAPRPAPAPAAPPPFPSKADEDAEILPGRRVKQKAPPPVTPPKPIVPQDRIPSLAPAKADEDAEILGGSRSTAPSAPRPAPQPGRMMQADRPPVEGEGLWLAPKPKPGAPAPEPRAAPAPRPAPAAPSGPRVSLASSGPGEGVWLPPKPKAGDAPAPQVAPATGGAPAQPHVAPTPPPAPIHSGFLSGRCLPLRIGESDARRMTERIVAVARAAELQLLPFHVFAYRCVLEGTGHAREATGLLWVSSANGAVLDPPVGDLVEDVGVPFTRLKAEVPIEAADERARTHLNESLVVREAVRKDFGDTSVLERISLKVRPGSLHLESLGTAHAPRWRVEGLDRTVFVDASTGEVIRA